MQQHKLSGENRAAGISGDFPFRAKVGRRICFPADSIISEVVLERGSAG